MQRASMQRDDDLVFTARMRPVLAIVCAVLTIVHAHVHARHAAHANDKWVAPSAGPASPRIERFNDEGGGLARHALT